MIFFYFPVHATLKQPLGSKSKNISSRSAGSFVTGGLTGLNIKENASSGGNISRYHLGKNK
jgi:hypothetical protein